MLCRISRNSSKIATYSPLKAFFAQRTGYTSEEADAASEYRTKVIEAAELLTYELYQESCYTHSIVAQKLEEYNADNEHEENTA
jgi:hypothetical protein